VINNKKIDDLLSLIADSNQELKEIKDNVNPTKENSKNHQAKSKIIKHHDKLIIEVKRLEREKKRLINQIEALKKLSINQINVGDLEDKRYQTNAFGNYRRVKDQYINVNGLDQIAQTQKQEVDNIDKVVEEEGPFKIEGFGFDEYFEEEASNNCSPQKINVEITSSRSFKDLDFDYPMQFTINESYNRDLKYIDEICHDDSDNDKTNNTTLNLSKIQEVPQKLNKRLIQLYADQILKDEKQKMESTILKFLDQWPEFRVYHSDRINWKCLSCEDIAFTLLNECKKILRYRTDKYTEFYANYEELLRKYDSLISDYRQLEKARGVRGGLKEWIYDMMGWTIDSGNKKISSSTQVNEKLLSIESGFKEEQDSVQSNDDDDCDFAFDY
jgi:hypothetical protein